MPARYLSLRDLHLCIAYLYMGVTFADCIKIARS